MAILTQETNHAWLQNFTWETILTKNDNVNVWKLIIPGYTKLHGDDFDEDHSYKMKHNKMKKDILFII